MTAILRQMDDFHYNHYINTFKTRQDIIVSQPGWGISSAHKELHSASERSFQVTVFSLGVIILHSSLMTYGHLMPQPLGI